MSDIRSATAKDVVLSKWLAVCDEELPVVYIKQKGKKILFCIEIVPEKEVTPSASCNISLKACI